MVKQRFFATAGIAFALAVSGAAPVAARPAKAPAPAAAPALSTLASALKAAASSPDLSGFYAARAYRPLWVDRDGRLLPAARGFIELAHTASLDEIDTAAIDLGRLDAAVKGLDWGAATPVAVADAEVAMTRSFAAYVRATRQAPAAAMLLEHAVLQPHAPAVRDLLETAARAPSLENYVKQMQWMHPLYAPLRAAFAASLDESPREVVAGNLERLRAIPPRPDGRYVLVDAATARLWMYENGRAVDSMKVVVGKPDLQTPMIAGYIRYAIVNPYWNVPPDLVRKNIATNVLSRGVSYLKSSGYQVLSDWSENATPVDPATVNWKKVAAGEEEVRVRQLPGGSNFMGKVKYEFPNKLGIYLHDTPDKDLLLKDARQFSSGCIRLEDADRLGRWLMEAPLPSQVEVAERRIDLPEPVPVYVTYLTARVDGGRIAIGPDPYHRDPAVGTRMARSTSSIQSARR